jgi:hypothetical protein
MTMNTRSESDDKSKQPVAKASEQRTAQVAADNDAKKQQDQAEREQAEVQQASTAAEKLQKSVDAGDTDTPDAAVAIDPYPDYSSKSVEELRSEAESRDVEIPRDVEKAHLVNRLRQERSGSPNPAYDFMPLEKLREAAKGEGVELDEEFEKAHLITVLRASDTYTL